MTFRQWEKAFKKRLSRLPGEERERALDYYAELYGDKLDAGNSEREIVRGFGDPKAAADKIVAEWAESSSAQSRATRPRTALTPTPALCWTPGWTPSSFRGCG